MDWDEINDLLDDPESQKMSQALDCLKKKNLSIAVPAADMFYIMKWVSRFYGVFAGNSIYNGLVGSGGHQLTVDMAAFLRELRAKVSQEPLSTPFHE